MKYILLNIPQFPLEMIKITMVCGFQDLFPPQQAIVVWLKGTQHIHGERNQTNDYKMTTIPANTPMLISKYTFLIKRHHIEHSPIKDTKQTPKAKLGASVFLDS